MRDRPGVDRDEFRDCCSDLVDRVVRRLVSLGIEGTLLQEEWASVQAADQDEAMFCGTAAGLGWDPYSLNDDQRAQVYDNARRFKFCRGLAEVLASPNVDALLTQARSDRQQWNRAFAAEFLAPSAELRARVARSTLDEGSVDELAAEFGVSSLLIAH